jgi:hypothetical protein
LPTSVWMTKNNKVSTERLPRKTKPQRDYRRKIYAWGAIRSKTSATATTKEKTQSAPAPTPTPPVSQVSSQPKVVGSNIFDRPPYQPPSSSSKPQGPVEADKIHPPFSPHSLFRCPPSQEEGKISSSSSSSEKQKTKEKKTAEENNNSSSSESKSASNNKTGNNGCKDNNNKNNCNRNSSTSSTNEKYCSDDYTSTTGRRHHNGGGNRIPLPSSPPACSANGGSGRRMDNSGKCSCGNDEESNKEKKCPKDATTHHVEEYFSCPWLLQALLFIIMLPLLIWVCLYALIVYFVMSMSQKKMETKHNHDSKETNKPDSSSSSSYADTCNKSDDKPRTKIDNKEPKNNDDRMFVKPKKSLKKKKTLPPMALEHHLSVFEMLDENGMINSDDELSLKALEKVHRKLRRKFHPDKNIGNEDIATKKFHRVDEAWHQLNKALEGNN